jgi:hypothetical protein
LADEGNKPEQKQGGRGQDQKADLQRLFLLFHAAHASRNHSKVASFYIIFSG